MVDLAIAFYPKRVQCLQRSVVTARMLRRKGIPADLIVGFRTDPFFAHAWIEVSGRVINDHAGYRKRLTILLSSESTAEEIST